jgi:hypothetical protein
MSYAARFLYELSNNLKSKADVDRLVETSQRIRTTITERGFKELIADINRNRQHIVGCEPYPAGFFDNSKLMPDPKSSYEYKRKHTVQPTGIGVVLGSNKGGLAPGGRGGDGLVIAGREMKGSTLGLDQIGFIILTPGDGWKARAEHELLHIDNYSYSNNHALLRDFPDNYKFSTGSFLLRVENAIKGELMAYRGELVGRTARVRDDIIKGTVVQAIYRITDYLARTDYGDKSQAEQAAVIPHLQQRLAHSMAPLVSKLNASVQAMEFLAEAPSRVITPALFSIGPTVEEIERGMIPSVLDEIVALAEVLDSGELTLDQISEGIRQKGHTI